MELKNIIDEKFQKMAKEEGIPLNEFCKNYLNSNFNYDDDLEYELFMSTPDFVEAWCYHIWDENFDIINYRNEHKPTREDALYLKRGLELIGREPPSIDSINF